MIIYLWRESVMKVGDLVRENISAENNWNGEAHNPPDVGMIIKYREGWWLVDFPSHGGVFPMLPQNLEVVSAAR